MNDAVGSNVPNSQKRSRLIYPLTIAYVALIASLIEWVMYAFTAHMAFATLLARHGDKFNLPLRLAMALWHPLEVYYVPLLVIVLVVTYIILLVGKKDKVWATQIAITLSILLVFFMQTVFLMTLFDLLPYINSVSP